MMENPPENPIVSLHNKDAVLFIQLKVAKQDLCLFSVLKLALCCIVNRVNRLKCSIKVLH